MNDIQNIMVLIAMGLGLIVLASVTMAVSVAVGAWAKRFAEQAADIDARLAPFGRTATGRYLHDQVVGARQYVDDVDDQLVVQTLMLVHKILPQTNDMVTAGQVSVAFKSVVDGLVDLLDGVAAKQDEGAEG